MTGFNHPMSDDAEKPRRSVPIAGLLACAAIVLAGISQVYTTRSFERIDERIAKIQSSVDEEFGAVQLRMEATGSSSLQALDAVREDLAAARRESSMGVRQAKAAKLHADKLVGSIVEQHQRQQEQVVGELTQVKETASLATARIADVSADVGSVKTEVASTKVDLERTVSDLKKVTGDMGVMSGLIATNGSELLALKELGDRHYHAFTLVKTKAPQRVGDVMVLLKSADVKRNRFTVEVTADDKRTEKKNKTVNEPVQFYVASKARQPYELVVNQVQQNKIIGYLAVPKVQLARQ